MTTATPTCTCSHTTGCPEESAENTCAHCRHLDPYDPCPVLGFGDGIEQYTEAGLA